MQPRVESAEGCEAGMMVWAKVSEGNLHDRAGWIEVAVCQPDSPLFHCFDSLITLFETSA